MKSRASCSEVSSGNVIVTSSRVLMTALRVGVVSYPSTTPSRRCDSRRRHRDARRRAALRDDDDGDVNAASTSSSSFVEAIELSGRVARARWIASEDGRLTRGKPIDARTGIETSSVGPELRRIFLPSGFPETVSADYVAWLRWHLVSLLFRDVLEILTAQSLLVALGMGSTPGALPLTAAAKWVLKDGVGSFATLLAGAFGGQKYDEDPKRWWALTNALEDVARAIELVTPAAPTLFLPLAASATFVRSAALTGRGSLMNGTFMQHFGRNQNLGDIRAKLEVQGRWLALVALPSGIQVFQLVSEAASKFVEEGDELAAFAASFGAYGCVIGVHAYACWRAAKALKFDSLNRFRLLKLAEAFVADEEADLMDCVALGDVEGVYRPRRTATTPTFGASPDELGPDWKSFIDAIRLSKGRHYVLGRDPKRGDVPSALLLDSGSARDALSAALAIQRFAASSATSPIDAYAYADAKTSDFEASLLRSGWRVDFIQLGVAPKFAVGQLGD